MEGFTPGPHKINEGCPHQLCDYLETQVAVWDMAPGSVDDCCFCCSIDGT